MNILITGGAGFIGSHLVEYYQDKADEIRVLDNLRTGDLENLRGLRYTFIEGSVTDLDTVTKAVENVDYVYHLAALVSVAESILKPAECVDINVNGLLNVLKSSAGVVDKVILASSAAIYGDNPVVPKVESMLPAPRSPYAITKLDGEYYLDVFRQEFGLRSAAIRFFNVFGPRQNPKGAYAAAVPIFIENALKEEDILIYGDGNQTRDFIYVKDIVSALVHAAQTPNFEGVYNAGYGSKITINELASSVTKTASSRSQLKYLPARAGDVMHSLAGVKKLHDTGWCPLYTLTQGLGETLEYFRAKFRTR